MNWKRPDVLNRLIDRGFEPLELDWDAAKDFAEFITRLVVEEKLGHVKRQEMVEGVQGNCCGSR